MMSPLGPLKQSEEILVMPSMPKVMIYLVVGPIANEKGFLIANCSGVSAS